MKPRIRLVGGTYRALWCCFGDEISAYGQSPSGAYRRWRINVDLARALCGLNRSEPAPSLQRGVGISRV